MTAPDPQRLAVASEEMYRRSKAAHHATVSGDNPTFVSFAVADASWHLQQSDMCATADHLLRATKPFLRNDPVDLICAMDMGTLIQMVSLITDGQFSPVGTQNEIETIRLDPARHRAKLDALDHSQVCRPYGAKYIDLLPSGDGVTGE